VGLGTQGNAPSRPLPCLLDTGFMGWSWQLASQCCAVIKLMRRLMCGASQCCVLAADDEDAGGAYK